MKSTMALRRPATMSPMHGVPSMRAPAQTAARIVPPLVILGCVAGVVSYVRTQLSTESGTMDQIFAQKNDERHEAARKKIYTEREPRRSLYNILSWR